MPDPIRRLLTRCFVDGHRRPGKRPTADEWHDALRRLRDEGFQACPREPRHVFNRRERRCPWCGDPNDRFAGRIGRIPRIRRIRLSAKPAAAKPTARAASVPRRPRPTPPQVPLPPKPAPAPPPAPARRPPAKLVKPKPAKPAKATRSAKPSRRARAPRARRKAARRRRSSRRWLSGRGGWLMWALLSAATGLLAFKAG